MFGQNSQANFLRLKPEAKAPAIGTRGVRGPKKDPGLRKSHANAPINMESEP